jgi:membrane-bound lytic murein transglycosylase B
VVRNLYQKERTPLLDILANNNSFFDFFNELNVIDSAREEVRKTVSDIESTKKELEVKKTTLDEQYEDQAATKKGLEIAKVALEQTKVQKNSSLQKTQAEEKNYKELLSLSKANLDKLKNEIFYMLKAGITAEDALKYGQAVANTIGLRPAFLLAILEIESRLGASVGTGHYIPDMNPNQRGYFLELMEKLGLDPKTTPVSKKPNYGWGGAMGPAQFLPGTWLGWESKIAKITGHNPPSPWSIEDSFTAAALKLYNDGASAKTAVGELRAAKSYISGNPNCTKSICNYYANLAIDKAADIEETLKNK